MKAVQMSYDHTQLMELSRELYLEHGWKMPRGLAKQSERDPNNFTFAEWQQAKRTKQHPNDIERAIKDAWAISDTKTTFSHALTERGYVLAKGDKKGRIVAVDTFGEIYAIPKKLGLRVKQVRERVGDEQALQSIEEAKQQIAKGMLQTLERFKKQLKTQQQQENTALKRERQDLIEWQRKERADFTNNQTTRQQQEATIRQARFRTGLKGLWDRLRGEHKRLRELNEREAKQAQEQVQAQKDVFIRSQLRQRQLLNERHRSLQRQYHHKQSEITQDIQRYRKENRELRVSEKQQKQLENLRDEFKRKREPNNRKPAQRRNQSRGYEL